MPETPEERSARITRERRLQQLGDAAKQLGLGSDEWDGDTAHGVTTKAQKVGIIRGVCATCKHSMIYRRPHGDPVTVCRILSNYGDATSGLGLVPNDIEWCSSHTVDREPMTLGEMERLALVIDTRPNPPQTNAYL